MNKPDEVAEGARGELAEMILSEFGPGATAGSSWRLNPTAAADRILAAGYRKPRTITTAEELDGLPYGSVVLDAARATATKLDADYWEVAGFASHFRVEAIDLPATVLYEPEPAK